MNIWQLVAFSQQLFQKPQAFKQPHQKLVASHEEPCEGFVLVLPLRGPAAVGLATPTCLTLSYVFGWAVQPRRKRGGPREVEGEQVEEWTWRAEAPTSSWPRLLVLGGETFQPAGLHPALHLVQLAPPGEPVANQRAACCDRAALPTTAALLGWEGPFLFGRPMPKRKEMVQKELNKLGRKVSLSSCSAAVAVKRQTLAASTLSLAMKRPGRGTPDRAGLLEPEGTGLGERQVAAGHDLGSSPHLDCRHNFLQWCAAVVGESSNAERHGWFWVEHRNGCHPLVLLFWRRGLPHVQHALWQPQVDTGPAWLWNFPCQQDHPASFVVSIGEKCCNNGTGHLANFHPGRQKKTPGLEKIAGDPDAGPKPCPWRLQGGGPPGGNWWLQGVAGAILQLGKQHEKIGFSHPSEDHWGPRIVQRSRGCHQWLCQVALEK